MCLVDGTRVHFVGRGGDMIKTASSNVSPAEVEMEMQALEEIEAAYVVGLPDQERGEIVAAAVVPCDGVTLDFAAIEAQIARTPVKLQGAARLSADHPRGRADAAQQQGFQADGCAVADGAAGARGVAQASFASFSRH